ncbi:hypothetical protein P9112_007468 [Eukaryota sp. TZLM1-RC]
MPLNPLFIVHPTLDPFPTPSEISTMLLPFQSISTVSTFRLIASFPLTVTRLVSLTLLSIFFFSLSLISLFCPSCSPLLVRCYSRIVLFCLGFYSIRYDKDKICKELCYVSTHKSCIHLLILLAVFPEALVSCPYVQENLPFPFKFIFKRFKFKTFNSISLIFPELICLKGPVVTQFKANLPESVNLIAITFPNVSFHHCLCHFSTPGFVDFTEALDLNNCREIVSRKMNLRPVSINQKHYFYYQELMKKRITLYDFIEYIRPDVH